MEVSVIVPIYNKKSSLNKCIESIINQTFVDFELIIIDDGSTDGSGEICDSFSEKDRRIKVFHKKNEGVSAARNTGIEKSSGKYILFIDSDDWIEINTIEVLVNSIKKFNSDLVMCSISYDYYVDKKLDSNLIKGISNINNYNVKELGNNFKELFEKCNFLSSCNKIFLANIIKENNIKYDTDCIIYEDFDFNLKVLDKSDRITIIPDILYHYIIQKNESILSRRNKINLVEDINKVTTSLITFLNNINLNNEDMKYMYEYMFVLYHHCINKLIQVKNEEPMNKKIEVLKNLKKDKNFELIMGNYGENILFYRVIYFLIKMKMFYIAYFLIRIKLE